MNETNGHRPNNQPDPARYDPTGEARIWDKAAEIVTSLRLDTEDADRPLGWNAALKQAARALATEALGVRQAGGAYYRVISGSNWQPNAE